MSRARILADYVAGGTTAAEFDYLDGVTSNIQTQFTAKAPLASPAFTGTPTGITAAHLEAGVLPSDVTFPAGHILQVESTTLTTGYTASNGSWTDITGLSVAITPKFSDSKVLVFVSMCITASNDHHARIARNLPSDPTEIAIGTGQTGSQVPNTFGYMYNSGGAFVETRSMNFLDSPATISAITYKVQAKGTSAVYVNMSSTDNDAANYGRQVSTITVMEVAQ